MFLIFAVILGSIDSSDGAWDVKYLSQKGCTGAFVSATLMTPRCIKSAKEGQYFTYECVKSPYYNVSLEIYTNSDCFGTPTYSYHVGDTDVCYTDPLGKGKISMMWKCAGDFVVEYDSLSFSIPRSFDNPNFGDDNPIIGQHYAPIVKCYDDPDLKHHLTTVCDKETKEGVIKIYEAGACLIPIHTMKLKPGDVVDFSKLIRSSTGGKMFMRFDGCISHD